MLNKQKLITLTPEMQAKIDELQTHLGYPSASMVIYEGITTLHQQKFPPHTLAMRKGPQEMIKMKEAQRKAREDVQIEAKREIVKQLKGKIEHVTGMGEVATYWTYAGRKRYKQETPLHLVTEEILATQFSPDKATVERLQKEKKTEY